MTFQQLLQKTRNKDTTWKPPARLLALDPGENTGWAVFLEGELVDAGQVDCKECAPKAIKDLILEHAPTHIIAEDYRVYGHKSDAHKWSSLFTPRLIGMIEYISWDREIHLDLQMAATVKQFCTLARLKDWGMYESSKRHAMDAIKHGTYYLLFHNRKTS